MAFIGNQPTAVPLTSSQLVDGIITTDKLAADAVTSAKILDSTIVNADIASTTINLTQKVTGTLPATNGGTGVASYTAGNILYASNATTLATLAPGTSGFALTLNGTTPTWAAVGASAGQVIQVVQATTTTNTTRTSGSYQTMNLSASITPSSTSNKVLVFACGGVFTATDGSLTFYRGSTNILSSAGFIRLGNNIFSTFSAQYLDSPSTTSSTTYAVYGKTGQQIQAPCQDAADNSGITAIIILMEVKG